MVVSPPVGVAGSDELRDLASGAGADVVIPEIPPPDMRASFLVGLAAARSDRPELAGRLPGAGDSPGLSVDVVASLLKRAAEHPAGLLVPTFGGKRGHPVLLPRDLAEEVRRLPEEVGINALFGRYPGRVVEVEADEPGILEDIDTPDDYRRWDVL